jgi:hypothetical protein
MSIILAYILMVLIGGIALWIVAKLFSGDSPGIIQCFIGAGIAEFVSLFGIPLVPFIVLFIVLIKIGGFEGMPAFFATMLYGIMKLFLFGIIVATLTGIFG